MPLHHPTDFDHLDAETIRAGLAARGEALVVEVCERCGSTNSDLMAREDSSAPALLLAEEQTAGRGRRGRRWHASRGTALTFSLRWGFATPVARLRGLSLAAGVGIANALRALGAQGVTLKWPNDLIAADGKLGGVLIETRVSAGRVVAVIGLGLNWRRQPGLGARLERRVVSLEELVETLPARNALATQVVAELARTLRAFDAGGFAAFRSEWESLHAQQGERIKVRLADGRVLTGIAEGIAADGALLLRNRNGVRSVASGSVVPGSALRAQAA